MLPTEIHVQLGNDKVILTGRKLVKGGKIRVGGVEVARDRQGLVDGPALEAWLDSLDPRFSKKQGP